MPGPVTKVPAAAAAAEDDEAEAPNAADELDPVPEEETPAAAEEAVFMLDNPDAEALPDPPPTVPGSLSTSFRYLHKRNGKNGGEIRTGGTGWDPPNNPYARSFLVHNGCN